MRVPETRFVQVDGLNIAYQVVGDGPIDLVHIPGFVSNVELAWEDPLLARFLERQAGFSRLILFDKRGTGMSDRVPSSQLPTLEQRMDDLVAVLDAVGSDQAALFGFSEGGSLAVLFAATYPERVRTLVTVGIFAKRVWSSDYPWAPSNCMQPEDSKRTAQLAVSQAWASRQTRRSRPHGAGAARR